MSTLLIKDIEHTTTAKIALWTFIIGTLFLIVCLLFPINELMFSGLIYALLAFVFNGLVAFVLFIYFLISPNERAYYGFQLLLLLINIPIATLYVFTFIYFKGF